MSICHISTLIHRIKGKLGHNVLYVKAQPNNLVGQLSSKGYGKAEGQTQPGQDQPSAMGHPSLALTALVNNSLIYHEK